MKIHEFVSKPYNFTDKALEALEIAFQLRECLIAMSTHKRSCEENVTADALIDLAREVKLMCRYLQEVHNLNLEQSMREGE